VIYKSVTYNLEKMDYNQSVYYMEKRGNLIGLSDEQKDEFVNLCESNFLFYDPYKDFLINPITSKKYRPNSLQRLYVDSQKTFEQKIKSELPTKEQVDKATEKLYSRKKRAFILQSLIGNFKYLGLIVGSLLGYFVDLKLGIAVGLYLIYWDYNTFDKVNGVINQIQSSFMTSLLWQHKRNLYFFGSQIILILSFISLYFYSQSLWLVAGIFLAQKWMLVNPTIQFIASVSFRGTEIVIQLKEEYQKQSKDINYVREDPKGIKIERINFYGDNLCEYEEIEDLEIGYNTVNDDFCSKSLFIYSKELIKKVEIENIVSEDYFSDELLRLENENLVEFYFERIPNRPESSYLVIAKEDFLRVYQFEGTYSHNILKSYYANGNVDNYQEYQHGIMHGLLKEYHDNGAIHFECSFDKGLLVPGKYSWKYDSGNIMFLGALRKKENESPERKDLYDPNSEFRIGIWEFFDEDGNIMKSVNYLNNGEKEIISWSIAESETPIWI